MTRKPSTTVTKNPFGYTVMDVLYVMGDNPYIMPVRNVPSGIIVGIEARGYLSTNMYMVM